VERNVQPADSFTHRRRLGVDVHLFLVLCFGNRERGRRKGKLAIYVIYRFRT
jgi:hypothetical protein